MTPKISPAEWEVLNAVWERQQGTALEIYQALADNRDWHQKTVNTFLTRLVAKGILRMRRTGKANVYAPKFSREQCIRAESATFLRRVFRGALAPMMLHFVEHTELSDAEIAELQKVLKQKNKQGTKP
jgi:BlaI family transcriptional regulator, penicillinase repressor